MLVFAGVVGAGIRVVGREYFLFRFDTWRPLKQIFWFVIMAIPLLGAPLYCFIVYSRSDLLRQASGTLPHEPRSRWNQLAQSGTSRTVQVKFSEA